MPHKRRICFVTGTRAEFGLMESTLRAIQNHPDLELQIVVTGMHLSAEHGKSIQSIRQQGWKIDAVAPWETSEVLLRGLPASAGGREAVVNSLLTNAAATGNAMCRLSKIFAELRPDILLIAGDRVEAFAAAAAGQIGGIVVAHIHGGDRAMGQADDSLRHAITKLSHVHFPATAESARRIRKLGEEAFRIHQVGSPGLDGITGIAADSAPLQQEFNIEPKKFALLVLHPTDANTKTEFTCAETIYAATRKAGLQKILIIYPNNDPGSAGIIRCWKKHEKDSAVICLVNVDRPTFLGLLRDSAMLIGNSSAGIIEAASFGVPVIDIGPRQTGRQRSGNVRSVSHNKHEIRQAITDVWNAGHPRRWRGTNIYAKTDTARKIAAILSKTPLDARLRRKLIEY